jgi:hypothetical protein
VSYDEEAAQSNYDNDEWPDNLLTKSTSNYANHPIKYKNIFQIFISWTKIETLSEKLIHNVLFIYSCFFKHLLYSIRYKIFNNHI